VGADVESGLTAPYEIVVRPRGAMRIDWHELWAYRELFVFLAWRDVKVRYQQTAIGVAWAVIQPFLTMVVFTVFFNRVAGIQSGPIPYPVFSFSGLLFWQLFTTGVTSASTSLISNSQIVSKVYFPRLIAPVSATMVAVVDFGFSFVVFVLLLAYYEIAPGLIGLLMLVPALLVSAVAVIGLGTYLAALNVAYRDVRYAIPFFIQLLLFVTPVIYPITLVPAGYRWLLYLNPMSGVISMVRAGLLGGAIPWAAFGISTVSAFALLGLGLSYFRRTERTFADLI
jgi:lipopolysaccharide transport system permease protein